MKKTGKQLEIERIYAENLDNALSELCITRAELAARLGISAKTAARYALGDTFPKKHAVDIGEYLFERSHKESLGFAHIPSDEFTPLFNRIMNSLGAVGVSEEEFAKIIGSSQTTLNNYRNTKGAICLPVEMQHCIIKSFSELVKADNAIDEFSPELQELIQHIDKNYSKERLRCRINAGEVMLSSLKEDRFNYFFLSGNKLRIVQRYLAGCFELFLKIEREINSHWNYMSNNSLSNFDYTDLPNEISFFDFKHKNDYSALRMRGAVGNMTADFLENFIISDTTDDVFSPEELSAVWFDLQRVLINRDEYLQTIYDIGKEIYFDYERECGTFFNDNDIIFPKTDFSEAEQIFKALPLAAQNVILRDFKAFFGLAVTGCQYKEQTVDLKSWIGCLTENDKSKFVEVFEAEILKDLLDNLTDIFGANISISNAYSVMSQYWDLMAFSEEDGFHCVLSDDALDKSFNSKAAALNLVKFRRYSKDLRVYSDPNNDIIDGVCRSPLDWYIYMLLDIAALKGMDMFDKLFGEIGMFYDMDKYINDVLHRPCKNKLHDPQR